MARPKKADGDTVTVPDVTAADRGVSQTKWQEHTRGYQPGRAMTLED